MVGIGIEICTKKKGNKRIMDSFCIWLYGEKVELKPKKKKMAIDFLQQSTHFNLKLTSQAYLSIITLIGLHWGTIISNMIEFCNQNRPKKGQQSQIKILETKQKKSERFKNPQTSNGHPCQIPIQSLQMIVGISNFFLFFFLIRGKSNLVVK